jgi:hypothetical protein
MKLFGLSDRKHILLFQDGADYYGTDPGLKWTQANGSGVDLSGTKSRTGIGAINCQGITAPFQTLPPSTNLFIGLGCFDPDASACTPIALCQGNTTTFTLRLTINVDGTVSLVEGFPGTTIATSAAVLNFGVYNYLELGFSQTSLLASVRVNGQQVIPPTAFSSGLPTPNIFAVFGPGGGAALYIDDVYVCNNVPSADPANLNDSFLGPVRLYSGPPIADSTPLQWTPSSGSAHFSLVSAIPPNGGTDYVSSNTPGDIDQYEYAIPSGVSLPVRIFGICVALLAEIDEAGGRSIGAQIGGTAGAGQALTTGYHIVSTEFDVNPDTGVAFVAADFPATTIGPVVTA